MSGAMRRFAKLNPKVFDPREFILASMKELEKLVSDRFERFGTAGNAKKINPISLPEMADRYADGAFEPRVKVA
jgi:fructose-bisphosphate aldolase class II